MKVRVDPRFVEHFNTCLEHYGCDNEEAQYEKIRILESDRSYQEACRCYSVIAAGIRNLT